MPSEFDNDPFKTVGSPQLCAWATAEVSCRIQTTDPAIVKILKRLPDCSLVGYSVQGRWIRIFSMPYTLQWVQREVINRLSPNPPASQ